MSADGCFTFGPDDPEVSDEKRDHRMAHEVTLPPDAMKRAARAIVAQMDPEVIRRIASGMAATT
jgi:hypothetical protein